jgi:hypothetical protein
VIDEPTERGILSSCRNSFITSKSRLKKNEGGEETGWRRTGVKLKTKLKLDKVTK